MNEITINKNDIKWEDEIFEAKALELSKKHQCYVVFNVFLNKVVFKMSKRKITGSVAENTYRYYGGIFHKGQIKKQTESFVKQFNKVTVR